MTGCDEERQSKDAAAESSVPDLSIVLVCWNGQPYLEKCLHSIYASNVSCRFEVIAVDNGSTDGTLDMLRTLYPQVRVIRNDENLGFAAGTNRGLAAVRGRFALLLNTDTVVHGPSIEAMLKFMDATPDAAVVGGNLLNPDGSFQAAFGEFSTLLQELLVAARLGELFRSGYPSHRTSRTVRTVDWLSGACLLVRPEAVSAVGGLDEDYFCYSEEVDLQFRLIRAGWKVYYLPDVRTTHYGGASSNRWRRRRLVYRGKLLFYRKSYRRGAEIALRVMLGTIAVAKCLALAPLFLLPRTSSLARREWRSNAEVLDLCLRLR